MECITYKARLQVILVVQVICFKVCRLKNVLLKKQTAQKNKVPTTRASTFIIKPVRQFVLDFPQHQRCEIGYLGNTDLNHEFDLEVMDLTLAAGHLQASA